MINFWKNNLMIKNLINSFSKNKKSINNIIVENDIYKKQKSDVLKKLSEEINFSEKKKLDFFMINKISKEFGLNSDKVYKIANDKNPKKKYFKRRYNLRKKK